MSAPLARLTGVWIAFFCASVAAVFAKVSASDPHRLRYKAKVTRDRFLAKALSHLTFIEYTGCTNCVKDIT